MKVIYTNWFIPKRFDAYNLIIVCLIRPEFKYDKGLHDHEYVHYLQWKRHPFTFPFMYLFNKTYRYCMEVEAYAAQLVWYEGRPNVDAKAKQFASLICNNYGLEDHTEDYTEQLLTFEITQGRTGEVLYDKFK
jgi:hypothetical protein